MNKQQEQRFRFFLSVFPLKLKTLKLYLRVQLHILSVKIPSHLISNKCSSVCISQHCTLEYSYQFLSLTILFEQWFWNTSFSNTSRSTGFKSEWRTKHYSLNFFPRQNLCLTWFPTLFLFQLEYKLKSCYRVKYYFQPEFWKVINKITPPLGMPRTRGEVCFQVVLMALDLMLQGGREP